MFDSALNHKLPYSVANIKDKCLYVILSVLRIRIPVALLFRLSRGNRNVTAPAPLLAFIKHRPTRTEMVRLMLPTTAKKQMSLSIT